MPISIREFNYNDPADGENVINMRIPRYKLPHNQGVEPLKAFQIIENIWIVPERYTFLEGLRDLNPPTDPVLGQPDAVYDENYLRSESEKDSFLKSMTKLFKRINSKDLGQSLLSLLSASIPLPGISGDKLTPWSDTTVAHMEKAEGKWNVKKLLRANIVLFGPGPNLANQQAIKFDMRNSSNGEGCISEVLFSPNYVTPFKVRDKLVFEKIFVPDPTITLSHELIHVLHGLYGIMVPKEKYFDFSKTLNPFQRSENKVEYEEILTFGGEDVNKIKDDFSKSVFEKALKQYRTIVKETINKVKNNDPLMPYLRDKIDITGSEGNYTLNENLFKERLTDLWFTCNEKVFADTFSVKTRDHYLMKYVEPPKWVNILDNKVYSVEEGFNIRSQNRDNFQGQLTDQSYFKGVDTARNSQVRACVKSAVYQTFGCINIEKKDLYLVSDKESFENRDFSEEPIGPDTMIRVTEDLPSRDMALSRYDFSQINSLPKVPVNQVVEREIVPPNVERSYDLDQVVNVDKLTTFHYLEAQKVDPTIDPKQVRFELTRSVEESLNNPNKVYTPFPTTAERINSAANGFANSYLFYQWLKDVVKDFSGEAENKDTLDKISDVTMVVPYVGAALNILNEVRHGDFVGALEVAGITALFEIQPELATLILVAYEVIGGELNKEQVAATVNNALAKRDEKWQEVYGFVKAQWWGMVHTQFRSRINQVYRSLSHQVNAIKANMEYQLAHYKGNKEDLPHLRKRIEETEDALNQSVYRAMNNVKIFMLQSSRSYLLNHMVPNVINKLKDFDAKTKGNLEAFIKKNESVLGTSLAQNLRNKVRGRLVKEIPFDVKDIPDLELDYLIKQYKTQIKDHQVFSLGVDNGHIIDLSGNKLEVVVGKDVTQVDGRDEKAIRLDSKTNAKIEVKNNELINFSYYDNFSISFWIRIPRPNKNSLVDVNNEYVLINRYNNSHGWKITLLDNKSLIWRFNEITLISPDIASNCWTHVTITNNQLNDESTMYINGERKGYMAVYSSRNNTINDPITIKIDRNKNKKQFIRLDQFNIYRKSLSEKEVKNLYKSYFRKKILRDIWGEPLRYNKNYYVQNLKYMGRGLEQEYYSWFGYSYILLQNEMKKALYRGQFVKILKRGKVRVDNLVRNRDEIYITLADYKIGLPEWLPGNQGKLYMVTEKYTSTGINDSLMIVQNDELDKNYCQMLLIDGLRGNGFLSIKDNGKLWMWSSTYIRENYSNLNKDAIEDIHWYFICRDEGWED